MKLLRIDSDNYSEIVMLASEMIKKSKIVAYPTETFYGLGVRYDDEDSLKRLYHIKKRPEERTMPLIIGDLSQLGIVTESINDVESLLIKEFWAGPLTIVFKARDGISSFIVKDGKVAVRLPGSKIARDISYNANIPITSTSANISNMSPAQDADTVMRYFSDSIDAILDGGNTKGGLPSTIVEVRGDEILIIRQGILKIDDFCKRFELKLVTIINDKRVR